MPRHTPEYNPHFAQQYAQELGILHDNLSGRAGGKRLLEWTFELPSHKPNITVPVSLEGSKDGMVFVARALDGAMKLTNPDIQVLYREVEAYLRGHVGTQMHIDWEDWFEVRVSGTDGDFIPGRSYSALGGELKIQVSKLKRGIHPKTGEVVTVHQNHVLVPFPTGKRRDEKPDVKDWLTDKAAEVAYIPATPENEAALREILERLATLRSRLSEVLQQELIQASLKDLSGQLLALSAPGKDNNP